jgi:hypothetical protein
VDEIFRNKKGGLTIVFIVFPRIKFIVEICKGRHGQGCEESACLLSNQGYMIKEMPPAVLWLVLEKFYSINEIKTFAIANSLY